uniref:Uncharacterized protein n=1 Tax=Physcomitrium patens TaxID=3218 RepID=A0A2K1IDH0_PHYPA|nr:hypothetical protein PHYPA_029477 [Physcomitrium patens]
MGKIKPKVRAKKTSFDPEEDPDYHMMSFFNSGEGGSSTSGGNQRGPKHCGSQLSLMKRSPSEG